MQGGKMVLNIQPEKAEDQWGHILLYVDLEAQVDGRIEQEAEGIDPDAL